MRSRNRKCAALPCSWDVHQRCGAPAWRQLLGSGHSPARDHPPVVGPFPGQASLCDLQRAAAHLPLLHEGTLFGGRRLAAGRSAGVLRTQAAHQQELAGHLPQITTCSLGEHPYCKPEQNLFYVGNLSGLRYLSADMDLQICLWRPVCSHILQTVIQMLWTVFVWKHFTFRTTRLTPRRDLFFTLESFACILKFFTAAQLPPDSR